MSQAFAASVYKRSQRDSEV